MALDMASVWDEVRHDPSLPQDAPIVPYETPCQVPRDCIQLIRAQGDTITSRVCDSMATQPAAYEILASTSTKKSNVEPVSAHGKSPRLAAQHLPGLLSRDSIFKDKATECAVKEVF